MLQDKWRIDAEIGRGGVASVFRATHRQGQVAAIKIIHAELAKNEEVRKRFLREGYAANKVGHPGVVRVLDDDVDKGSAFIVMELLGDGELLEDRRVRLGGRLPVAEVADVGLQMLDVLAAAHDKGIIHRDIKPENIFILGDGTVKVLDFGIAHIKEAVSRHEATATGLLLGTPEYMAPEQALGKRGQIDAQTDIFALGATLFTLLSGESVHPCDTMTALLVAAASRQPRSLASAAFKDLPRPVIAVVDKALALEKARRWPSARAMQAALRAAVPAPAPMRDIGSDETAAVPEPPVARPASPAPAARAASVAPPALPAPAAPLAQPPVVARPKLPVPSPPQRSTRASAIPPPMPVEAPEPPSVPPSSAPTAVLIGRLPPPPAAMKLDAPMASIASMESEDGPTERVGSMPPDSERIAPPPPSDSWAAQLAEMEGPTVAMKGPLPTGREHLVAAVQPQPPPPPREVPRADILEEQRTTSKLEPIAWPVAPVRASHPPPPMILTYPPPPGPSWTPAAPFAPPHVHQPMRPVARAAQPSPIVIMAIAIGALLLLALSIGSCVWLRSR